MRLLPLVLATLPLLSAPSRRALDVALRVDAPKAVARGFAPPFQVEVAFVAENPGLGAVTFSGRCPWEDPSRPLGHRWKSGLVLEAMPRARALRNIRYLVTDRAGRTVAAFNGADARIHAESLKGILLHLTVGTLGEPGAAVTHIVELEF
ncbi:hypothetical protein [Mesoterricola silvestris]|uniref:Uncharacterized protein n=1 Tax=Mesoterricola silvestris TaxID=2927979 RepID=A0AA48H4A1_9BACT|nr:hypothetical protein [Mesoterricola silvestris]BDU71598.1 hypothetical protein METEAL_07720 [Mesoterricola silvestris]